MFRKIGAVVVVLRGAGAEEIGILLLVVDFGGILVPVLRGLDEGVIGILLLMVGLGGIFTPYLEPSPSHGTVFTGGLILDGFAGSVCVPGFLFLRFRNFFHACLKRPPTSGSSFSCTSVLSSMVEEVFTPVVVFSANEIANLAAAVAIVIIGFAN